MITITKLQVNTVTNHLVISATDDTDSYKFTKIAIDSASTFNCKNEESTSAVTINIDGFEENQPLVDYKVEFNDIYNIKNPESDLFFVWVYADEYKEYLGYLYEGFIYFTDGNDNYYKFIDFEGEVFTSSESEYKTAKSAGSAVVKSYKHNSKGYVKYFGGDSDEYYYFEDTSFTETTEEDYNLNRSKQFSYPAFGLTLSVKDFYNLLLNNIEIQTKDSTHCNPSCSDVNFMLAWQGFNLAKSLQDYNQMVYYWNILHSLNTSSSHSNCCNNN